MPHFKKERSNQKVIQRKDTSLLKASFNMLSWKEWFKEL